MTRSDRLTRPANYLRAGAVALAIAAVFLGGVGWTAFMRFSDFRQAAGWVVHTLRVREDAGRLLTQLLDAETGERAFIITGSEDYLEPYRAAVASIPGSLDQLRRDLDADVARDPQSTQSQQARLAQLDGLIRQTVDRLQATITTRENQGPEAGRAIVAAGTLKQLMDQIRGVVAAIQSEEDLVLDTRESAEQQRARRAFATTAAGLGGAVLLLALAGVVVVNAAGLRERERAARNSADAVSRAIRESEERLRVTLMSIGDAVIATDAQGRVNRMNPIAESLTGWTVTEATGRPLEEVLVIVNERTRAPADNPVHRVIREGAVVGLANHTILLARDGREIPIDDSAAPIRSAEGSVVGAVLVFRDITERRRREREETERLDAQHARAMSSAESLGRMGSWRFEPGRGSLSWSPGMYRVFGLPEDTPLTPEAFNDFLHPDDRDRVAALVGTALEQRVPFRYQGRIIRRDGAVRILDSQGGVETDGNGAAVALFGFSRDVTDEVGAEEERRQATEALRAQKELYEKLLGAQSDVGDGVVITEGARIVYANDALARIYGYSREELLALPSFLDLVVPEDRERLARSFRRRLAGEKYDMVSETRVTRKDGSVVTIEYAAKPVEGTPQTQLIAIIRDVTHRRQADEELREQKELYEKLLGAQSDVGDGVAITEGTRMIFANEALAKMYGYSVEELRALPSLMDLIVPEDRQRLVERLQHRLEGDLVGEQGETRVIRRDGQVIINEYAVKPVQVRGKTLIIAIVRDVTERRRAEESVRQLSRRLLELQDEEQERIARELQRLVGRTMEGIRARIAAVRDSGTVFDWKTSEAVRESLRLIGEAITEVSTLSRLLYPPLLDEDGLSEAIRWYAFEYTQKTGVKVTVDVPLRFRRLGRDVERMLFRVVQESLANTARHSGSDIAVVRLSEEGADGVRIEVEDRGRGIPPGILEDSRGTVAISGVGIRGMFQRMSQLGGKMEISSTPFGTRVTAILPRAAESAGAPGSSAAPYNGRSTL